MKQIMLFFLASLSLAPLCAQSSTGGIVYGEDWAYFVSAPAGWIMDSMSPMDKTGEEAPSTPLGGRLDSTIEALFENTSADSAEPQKMCSSGLAPNKVEM